MTADQWITIAAILAAPLAAVQVQKWLESYREAKGRKVGIFKTLMATRAATLSPDHVHALNMIDLEFRGKNFRKVALAWKTYLDHLSSYPKEDEKAQPIWRDRSVTLLTALLLEMGKSLGYPFDEVHVKKAIYFPEAHGILEQEQTILRRVLIRVLVGELPLKMNVTGFPADEKALAEQKHIRDLLIQLLGGERDFPVRLSHGDQGGDNHEQ